MKIKRKGKFCTIAFVTFFIHVVVGCASFTFLKRKQTEIFIDTNYKEREMIL